LCDLKREEFINVGVHLQSGKLLENIADQLEKRTFQVDIPHKTHLMRDIISIDHAWQMVVTHIHTHLAKQDVDWANRAQAVLDAEQAICHAYYSSLKQTIPTQDTSSMETDYERQYAQRLAEIEWQYKPRIRVSLTSGGLFHVKATTNISPAV
jgi:hypothetical protein